MYHASPGVPGCVTWLLPEPKTRSPLAMCGGVFPLRKTSGETCSPMMKNFYSRLGRKIERVSQPLPALSPSFLFATPHPLPRDSSRMSMLVVAYASMIMRSEDLLALRDISSAAWYGALCDF